MNLEELVQREAKLVLQLKSFQDFKSLIVFLNQARDTILNVWAKNQVDKIPPNSLLRQHPIIQLYTHRLAVLTGWNPGDTTEATERCTRMANGDIDLIRKWWE